MRKQILSEFSEKEIVVAGDGQCDSQGSQESFLLCNGSKYK